MIRPKWLSEVRPISRRMSSWPMATNAPYTIEISASVTTTGVAHSDAPGQQPEAEPDHAERADLVEDADQQHAGAGRRLLGGVGQPGVQREQRRLDREGDEEADEQPALGVRGDVELGQVGDEVRRARRRRRRRRTGRSPSRASPGRRRAGRSGTSARRSPGPRGRSRRSGSRPGSAWPRRRRRRGTRRWRRRPRSRTPRAPASSRRTPPGCWSPSCQDAIITIGTSTTVSRIITRPRPSTPRA